VATRTQKVKVAVFLVVSGVLIVGGIMLALGFRGGHRIPYHVIFKESILGVNPGGMVEYLGIPVGVVEGLSVTEDVYARVDILIDPYTVTLHEGTKAQLVVLSLAAGTMAVSLSGSNPSNPPLEPGSKIPAIPSTFTSVANQVQTILVKLGEILDQFEKGLAGMKEGQLTKLLDDVDEFMADGSAFLDSATSTVENFSKQTQPTVEELRSLIDSYKKLGDQARSFVDGLSNKLEPLQLDKTQEDVHAALQSVQTLSERLETLSSAAETSIRALSHKTDNLDYEIRQAIESWTETLNAVKDLANELKQNPSALIRGKSKVRGFD